MIEVFINGQAQQLQANSSVDDAIKQWQNNTGQFAVALNKQFVPKSSRASQVLQAGDQIDVVSPIQGG
jgi:sulfur carrier protein